MSSQVLLLNADLQPLGHISWERAICLFFTDKVQIVRSYDQDLRSASISMKMPAVIKLATFSKHRHKVKFSRWNVLQRDEFMCQYCGDKPGTKELTIDHIMPQARGGKTTWENCVAACVSCNQHRKQCKTPKEAGMTLRKVPRTPTMEEFVRLSIGRKIPDAWRDFVWWNCELDNENP